jgi:hypothetical protein
MWGEYTKKMINIIKKFRDLPHYNVIFTCLEDSVQDETKKTSFFPVIAGSKAKSVIKPMFDELFRYCIIENERKLVTNTTNVTMAKDRSGKLELLEAPDLGVIFNKIKGVEKK